jgi:hypothetical protein
VFFSTLRLQEIFYLLLFQLLCAAARVSALQWRSTSEVFLPDRPSQESLSSGTGILLLQDLENLVARSRDFVSVFTQGRQLRHNALAAVRLRL